MKADIEEIHLSVREFVEYAMRSGDINAVFLSSRRMNDGIKAHQKFQKQAGEGYSPEVTVEYGFDYEGLNFRLSGRIDGVLDDENGIVIDEIKSTGRSVADIREGSEVHWAQVLVYGYMFCKIHALEKIRVRLTYIELEQFAIKQFVLEKTVTELEAYFYKILEGYIRWAKTQQDFKTVCLDSVAGIPFPFGGFRIGQKQLMTSVFQTIDEGRMLFSRAPTGIGKTVATLFPAIKALGQGKCEKIFYLTAKNIGKEVALSTLSLMADGGLRMKRVVITAKDKTCLMDERRCDPDYCPYAKGHFDRVNKALEALYEAHDAFDRVCIEEAAKEHRVCPYELSLDLAVFSQVIVCDYNYVFDPSASLKRFFAGEAAGRYALLIDEAHNLVDRAREMYSASMDKDAVMDLKRKVKNLDPKLHQYFTKLNKLFIEKRRLAEEAHGGHIVEMDLPHEFEEALRAVIYRTEKIFEKHQEWAYMEDLLTFYFDAYDFVKKTELYDACYVTLYEKTGQNLRVKLFCMDPSHNLKAILAGMQGVIYFSATLMPMDYHIRLLGGDERSYGLTIESPFDPDNLCLLVDKSINTRFHGRNRSIERLVRRIKLLTAAKKGNYMVFFPSYHYMQAAHEHYRALGLDEGQWVVMQERYMDDRAREGFLNLFQVDAQQTLVAFVVLSGVFGEGIDLTGERLIGSIVVSVGLPQVCLERDLLKQYFEDEMSCGFEYAYIYPGMNKVMQSAGRVIRTMTDRGVVALIDERFMQPAYRTLFPEEWRHGKVITGDEEMTEYLDKFWKKWDK